MNELAIRLWGLVIAITIKKENTIMGILSFLKKSPARTQIQTSIAPYKDSSTNFIYNLLFCDDLNLFKEKTKQPYTYPYNILFSETSTSTDLQEIIDDKISDPRIKILAYNRQRSTGHKTTKKELLAVIVEVGLKHGLDVLACFENGTARYINQTGKILIWETTNDETANKITNDLFVSSQKIVDEIGIGSIPRRPNPKKGYARITFLTSEGVCFGEGPTDALFTDPVASTALTKSTELMQYLTQKSLDCN